MSSQTERLRAYLELRGSITPLEAWERLGIYRLAARIADLRRQGVPVVSERVEVENRWREKCRVARYSIGPFA